MDTQTGKFSVSLSIFPDEIQLGLRVMKFLFVLSMLLGAVSAAQGPLPSNMSMVLSRQLRLLPSYQDSARPAKRVPSVRSPGHLSTNASRAASSLSTA